MERMQVRVQDIGTLWVENQVMIVLYAKTSANRRICLIDRFEPYFFVFPRVGADVIPRLESVRVALPQGKFGRVTHIESEVLVRDGEEIPCLKVSVNIPEASVEIAKLAREWEEIEGLSYHDVGFLALYAFERQIVPFTIYDAEMEASGTHKGLPMYNLVSIKPTIDVVTENKVSSMYFSAEFLEPFMGRLSEDRPLVAYTIIDPERTKTRTWKLFRQDTQKMPFRVDFVRSEIELIEALKRDLESVNMDVMWGFYSDFFEIPWILRRCRHYRMTLNVEWDGSPLREPRSRKRMPKWNGLVHIDIFRTLRKLLGSTSPEDMTVGSASLLDVSRDAEGLKYCMKSFEGCSSIEKYAKTLWPLYEELLHLTSLPLFYVSRMTRNQVMEAFMTKRAVEKRQSLPARPMKGELGYRVSHSYPQAPVREAIPALHSDVIVLDYRQLYAYLIRTHNLSHETFCCSCCREKSISLGDEEVWMCARRQGFLADVVADLEARGEKSRLRHILLAGMLEYLKYPKSRWFSPALSNVLEKLARRDLEPVLGKIEELGAKILFVNHQYVFLSSKDADQLVRGITELSIPFPIVVRGTYTRALFAPSRTGKGSRKYALLSASGDLELMGFEITHQNYCEFARRIQKEVITRILKTGDPALAFSYVEAQIVKLRSRQVLFESLIIRNRLAKDPQKYEVKLPHVRVAESLQSQGYDLPPGSTVPYVIREGPGKLSDRAVYSRDATLADIDTEYYIAGQVLPLINPLFQLFGKEVREG